MNAVMFVFVMMIAPMNPQRAVTMDTVEFNRMSDCEAAAAELRRRTERVDRVDVVAVCVPTNSLR